MEQEEFTEFTISYFLTSFPEFKNCIQIQKDKTADIKFPSGGKKLILYISTRSNELTVGFLAGQGQFGWHVHMDIYGAETPLEKVETAIGLIKEILSDKRRIVYSSYLGYFLTENEEGLEDYKEEDEIIELTYWSEL